MIYVPLVILELGFQGWQVELLRPPTNELSISHPLNSLVRAVRAVSDS